MILLSFLTHHSEAGDPDLLDWIKHQIDATIGVGPLLMVILLGLVLVSVPTVIMLAYMAQRRRGGFRQR